MVMLETFNCGLEPPGILYMILPSFPHQDKRERYFCWGPQISSPEPYPRRDAA